MSTGPRPQATFVQVNQKAAEQDSSHSALFYLFQEVSKLASPTHNSFLDANSASKWLNETSRPRNFIIKKEDDAHSFQPCQHSLSHMLAYSQVSSVAEEHRSNNFATSAEPHHECSSPWKVLSLINLQCERLMHRKHVEDSDQSLVSPTTDLPKDHPTAMSLMATVDVAEQSCVRSVEDVTGDCTQDVNKYQRQSCSKVSKKDCSIRLQTPERTDTPITELVEENSVESARCQHREVKFSVDGQLVFKQDTFSTEQENSNPSFATNAYVPNAPENTKMTFNLNEDASVPLPKQPLTLDCNANIVITTESPCDTQLPPPGSILPPSLFSNTSESHSFPNQHTNNIGPKPDCAHTPKEDASLPVSAQLQSHNVSSATLKRDPRKVQKVDISPPLSQQWRTKTPRKQPYPSRSVDIQDPDLQGVTFRMDTEVDDSREQCRLLITSKYKKELCRSVRKPRLRTRTSQKALKSSSSEEESDPTMNASNDKVCASCSTRKTPMWRDAEDGTPLCNACGIRYKKYRIRCVNCWHIPRKEGNSNSCCLKCGNIVKLASAHRKRTT